jgi:hypothetical protein
MSWWLVTVLVLIGASVGASVMYVALLVYLGRGLRG